MRAFAALVMALIAALRPGAADTTLADASYPEGALWNGGQLYYAEMTRDVVMVSDLSASKPFWRRDDCSPVSIAPYGKTEFLVLCHLAHEVVRVSRTGKTIATLRQDRTGEPIVYPNGSSADDAGGVYFTSSGKFDLAAPATGAVLYLDRTGNLTRVADHIRYANGIVADPARQRLYVSAHLARTVLAFPILGPGELGPPAAFFKIDDVAPLAKGDYPRTGPDGLEIDGDGNIIVAEYGAGRLHKVAPDGAWLGMQAEFAPFVTDVALLPGDRAAITATRINNKTPYPGAVVIRERFSRAFVR